MTLGEETGGRMICGRILGKLKVEENFKGRFIQKVEGKKDIVKMGKTKGNLKRKSNIKQ